MEYPVELTVTHLGDPVNSPFCSFQVGNGQSVTFTFHVHDATVSLETRSSLACIYKIRRSNLLRREVMLALAGFHAGPLSWSNWNLEMLFFVEVGKQENKEKNPPSRRKPTTNSTHMLN